ncbi:MAG: metallophosphoesterase [Hyphomicrobiaceae bacterium]|nr:MAG: metallophosphoesterase [Hyphomicrobiaceae bacterium]
MTSQYQAERRSLPWRLDRGSAAEAWCRRANSAISFRPMSQIFSLAHLSDVHLPLPRGITLGHFRAKRLLGLANWHRHRKHAHQRPVLDRLVADLALAEVDHVVVTGDLVNLGLPNEHEAALKWLRELGPPERISVVPGNHDAYVRLRHHPGHGRWSEYMNAAVPLANGAGFPFVRRLGRLALVGLNSGVPTPPIISYGRLGKEQLEALHARLKMLGSEGLIRVVMIHHPPWPMPAAWRMGLTDAAEFQKVLADAGAELVLHGHLHRQLVNWAKGPRGPIPIIGVPSASEGKSQKGDLARYNLYRLNADDQSLRIEMVSRGILAPHGAVQEVERRLLSVS